MSSISSALREIQSKSTDSRYKLYEKLLDDTVLSKNTNSIVEFVQHLVSREGADTYGRTYITPELLVYLIAALEDKDKKLADPLDLEELTPLLNKIVDIIRPRVDDYPDALMVALKLLSECHHAEGNYKQAALALSSFSFDDYRGKCTASLVYRVRWIVSCAEFYLDPSVAQSGHAGQQIKKAHALIAELNNLVTKNGKSGIVAGEKTSDIKALLFQFKTVYARVLDNERKFLEASLRYMELSQTGQGLATDDELLKALELAVTCGILSKAGPPRSRVLAMLYSDPRSQHLANYSLLEKMFKDQIIRPSEVDKFEKMLEVHQNANTGTGRTVLQNSIIEHNLLAASKLYHNIKFSELGVLLNISAHAAESLASTMIEQGRMRASIDQVENIVEFIHDKQGSTGTSGATGVFGEWDAAIGDLAFQIGRLTDSIQANYPQYKL